MVGILVSLLLVTFTAEASCGDSFRSLFRNEAKFTKRMNRAAWEQSRLPRHAREKLRNAPHGEEVWHFISSKTEFFDWVIKLGVDFRRIYGDPNLTMVPADILLPFGRARPIWNANYHEHLVRMREFLADRAVEAGFDGVVGIREFLSLEDFSAHVRHRSLVLDEMRGIDGYRDGFDPRPHRTFGHAIQRLYLAEKLGSKKYFEFMDFLSEQFGRYQDETLYYWLFDNPDVSGFSWTGYIVDVTSDWLYLY